MHSLPIWSTIGTAIRTAGSNAGILVRFAIVPFVLIFCCSLTVIYLNHNIYLHFSELDASEKILVYSVIQAGVMVLGELLTIPLAIRAYRLFFFGREAIWLDGLFSYGRAGLRLAIFMVLLLGFLQLPADVIEMMDEYFSYVARRLDPWATGGSYQVWYLLLTIVLLFLQVRLCFFYPALAIGGRWSFRRRWAEAKGKFWRIFAILAVLEGVVIVPAIAIGLLVYAVTGLWWEEVRAAAPFFTDDPRDYWAVGEFRFSLPVMITAGFLSLLLTAMRLLEAFGLASVYAEVTGRPAAALGHVNLPPEDAARIFD